MSIYAIHKIIDNHSFNEIQLLHGKSSFKKVKIEKMIHKINDYVVIKNSKFFEAIGNVYFDQDQYKESLNWYEKTIQSSEKELEKAICYQKKANIFFKLKQNEKNIEHLLLSAKNFYLANEKEKAIQVYISIVDFCEENIKESSIIGEAFNELGLIYQKSNNGNKAKNYFEKAIQIFENFDQEKIVFCYKNIASLHLENSNGTINYFKKTFTKEKALEYYQKAYSLFNKKGNSQEKFVCQLKIGKILQKLNRNEEALDEYKEAYNNLLEIKYDNKEMLSECCINIAKILLKKSNKKDALIFFKSLLKYFEEEKKFDITFNYIKETYQNTKHENTEIFAKICNDIGNIYSKYFHYEKATEFYEKAGNIFYKLEKKQDSRTCYINATNSLLTIIQTLSINKIKKRALDRKRCKLIAQVGDISLELNKKTTAIKEYLEAANSLVKMKSDADLLLAADLYKKIANIYLEQVNNKKASKIYVSFKYLKKSNISMSHIIRKAFFKISAISIFFYSDIKKTILKL